MMGQNYASGWSWGKMNNCGSPSCWRDAGERLEGEQLSLGPSVRQNSGQN
jgi:hypothetical protein